MRASNLMLCSSAPLKIAPSRRHDPSRRFTIGVSFAFRCNPDVAVNNFVGSMINRENRCNSATIFFPDQHPPFGTLHAVRVIKGWEIFSGGLMRVYWGEDDDRLSVEDLSKAMFIEGARVLGFQAAATIPLEAQEKILLAAASIVERLPLLLQMQRAD
jgi:hypothetical protein